MCYIYNEISVVIVLTVASLYFHVFEHDEKRGSKSSSILVLIKLKKLFRSWPKFGGLLTAFQSAEANLSMNERLGKPSGHNVNIN